MSNPQIHVRFLHHRHVPQIDVLFQILISMAVSQIDVQWCHWHLTIKSAIYLRIWKGCRFEKTLKLDRFEWMPIWVRTWSVSRVCVYIYIYKILLKKFHKNFVTDYISVLSIFFYNTLVLFLSCNFGVG